MAGGAGQAIRCNNNTNMKYTTTPAKRPRHRKILISPTGEEFYEAYGPMTKDPKKATLYFTNPKTIGEPSRFGNTCGAFWNSELEAAKKARKEYVGWTFRNEPVIQHHRVQIGLDFIGATGSRTTCFQLIAGGFAVAAIDYHGDTVNRESFAPTLRHRAAAIRRLSDKCRARSIPQTFAPTH